MSEERLGMGKDKSKDKIVLSGVSKSFAGKRVLEDVNLSIGAGESLVIIGSSGCGKSVLLKAIIGLLALDSGSISVDGVEVQDLPISERCGGSGFRIGMLFQYAALFDSLNVRDNVAFGLRHGSQHMGRDEAYRIADVGLAEVGLDAVVVGDLYPAELSGGMKKRVGLARALAGSPDILFFDEPTTGLDPIMGRVIDNLISDSVRVRNATAITITHDLESARRVGDRCAMLHGGRIVWHGSMSELDSSDNPYLVQFRSGSISGPIDLPIRKL